VAFDLTSLQRQVEDRPRALMHPTRSARENGAKLHAKARRDAPITKPRQHNATMDRMSVDGKNVSEDRLSASPNLSTALKMFTLAFHQFGGKPFAV
jgi:hypothetical protein